MLRKIYVRGKGGFPASEPQSTAFLGFRERGVETTLFEDVSLLTDISHEVGVAGHIGDVWKALDKLGIPRPPSFDYPKALSSFLGRKVWLSTLDEALDLTDQKLFVKSTAQKLLTGFAFTGAYRDKIKMAGIPGDTPVWLSDAVNFVSEYRCFILRGEVLDARLYKGDWGKAPDRKVVEAAVAAWPEAPAAYSLDVGVVDDGRTLLVEVNDGFALGSYGILPNFYAQMIEARWEQMVPNTASGLW